MRSRDDVSSTQSSAGGKSETATHALCAAPLVHMPLTRMSLSIDPIESLPALSPPSPPRVGSPDLFSAVPAPLDTRRPAERAHPLEDWAANACPFDGPPPPRTPCLSPLCVATAISSPWEAAVPLLGPPEGPSVPTFLTAAATASEPPTAPATRSPTPTLPLAPIPDAALPPRAPAVRPAGAGARCAGGTIP